MTRPDVLRKMLCAGIALIFSISGIQPQLSLGAEPLGQPAGSFPEQLADIRIPPNIGKIEELHDTGSGPLVLLVQDAHSIPEAQRNIRNLIDFFQQKFGLSRVAVEGAASKFNPQIFRSFPDREILKDVLTSYLNDGELTGPAFAAIANRSEAFYTGIEDWKLYEEGYRLFLSAMAKTPAILEGLAAKKAALLKEKEVVYSRELLEVDRVLSRFRENSFGLLETLQVLSRVKPPEPESELALLLKQSDGRNFASPNFEAALKKAAMLLKKELDRRASDPGFAAAAGSFNDKWQQYQTSALPAGDFALYLRETVAGMNLPLELPPELLSAAAEQKRMRDIEGTRFFENFEQYARSVKQKLIRTGEERRIDGMSERLYLLEKLANLELTVLEWRSIRPWLDERENGGFRLRPEAGLEEEFSFHAGFYENSARRDEIFEKNLKKLAGTPGRQGKRTREAVLFVSGGFHTENLVSGLKQAGLSYLLIVPAIGRLPSEVHYKDHMRGTVSWRNYFRAEGNRIDLHKAFVRAARDRLLRRWAEAKKADALNGGLLKQWRDQLIRDLASDGRLMEAQDSTVFLDELRNDSRKTAENPSARIEELISGMKALRSNGQLNEENLMKLLRPSTMVAPVLNGLAEGASLDLRALPPGFVLTTGTESAAAGERNGALVPAPAVPQPITPDRNLSEALPAVRSETRRDEPDDILESDLRDPDAFKRFLVRMPEAEQGLVMALSEMGKAFSLFADGDYSAAAQQRHKTMAKQVIEHEYAGTVSETAVRRAYELIDQGTVYPIVSLVTGKTHMALVPSAAAAKEFMVPGSNGAASFGVMIIHPDLMREYGDAGLRVIEEHEGSHLDFETLTRYASTREKLYVSELYAQLSDRTYELLMPFRERDMTDTDKLALQSQILAVIDTALNSKAYRGLYGELSEQARADLTYLTAASIVVFLSVIDSRGRNRSYVLDAILKILTSGIALTETSALLRRSLPAEQGTMIEVLIKSLAEARRNRAERERAEAAARLDGLRVEAGRVLKALDRINSRERFPARAIAEKQAREARQLEIEKVVGKLLQGGVPAPEALYDVFRVPDFGDEKNLRIKSGFPDVPKLIDLFREARPEFADLSADLGKAGMIALLDLLPDLLKQRGRFWKVRAALAGLVRFLSGWRSGKRRSVPAASPETGREKTIMDIAPIEKGADENLTLAAIPQYVEEPFVEAVRGLYRDKHIKTTEASASAKNFGEPPHYATLLIDYRSLSEANRRIADGLVRGERSDALASRLGPVLVTHDVTGRGDSLTLSFPIAPDMSVRELSAKAVEVAGLFEKQTMRWAAYTLEDLRGIYSFPEGRIEDFTEQWSYDPETGLFYGNPEYLEMERLDRAQAGGGEASRSEVRKGPAVSPAAEETGIELGKEYELARFITFQNLRRAGVKNLGPVESMRPKRIWKLINRQAPEEQAFIEWVSNGIDASSPFKRTIGRFGMGEFQSLRFLLEAAGTEFERGAEMVVITQTETESHRVRLYQGPGGERDIRFVIEEIPRDPSRRSFTEKRIVFPEGFSGARIDKFEQALRGKLRLQRAMRIMLNGELVNPLDGYLYLDGRALEYASAGEIQISIDREKGEMVVRDPGSGMGLDLLLNKYLMPREGMKEEGLAAKEQPEEISREIAFFYRRSEKPEKTGKMRASLLVSGVLIESFETEGMNLPADLVLDLPSATYLTLSRNQVGIDEILYEAFRQYAMKLRSAAVPPAEQDAVINGFMQIARYLDQRAAGYKMEEADEFSQVKRRGVLVNIAREVLVPWVQEIQEQTLLLPNHEAFREIEAPAGARFLDADLLDSVHPSRIAGAEALAYFRAGTAHEAYVVNFRSTSEILYVVWGDTVLINRAYYEDQKDLPFILNTNLRFEVGYGQERPAVGTVLPPAAYEQQRPKAPPSYSSEYPGGDEAREWHRKTGEWLEGYGPEKARVFSQFLSRDVRGREEGNMYFWKYDWPSNYEPGGYSSGRMYWYLHGGKRAYDVLRTLDEYLSAAPLAAHWKLDAYTMGEMMKRKADLSPADIAVPPGPFINAHRAFFSDSSNSEVVNRYLINLLAVNLGNDETMKKRLEREEFHALLAMVPPQMLGRLSFLTDETLDALAAFFGRKENRSLQVWSDYYRTVHELTQDVHEPELFNRIYQRWLKIFARDQKSAAVFHEEMAKEYRRTDYTGEPDVSLRPRYEWDSRTEEHYPEPLSDKRYYWGGGVLGNGDYFEGTMLRRDPQRFSALLEEGRRIGAEYKRLEEEGHQHWDIMDKLEPEMRAFEEQKKEAERQFEAEAREKAVESSGPAAFDHEGNIYQISRRSRSENFRTTYFGTVSVFTPQGEYRGDFGAEILKAPTRAVFDSRGRLLVLDRELGHIVLFDRDGRMIGKIEGKGEWKFDYRYMAVDSKDRIYLSRGNEILIFDAEGNPQRRIRLEGGQKAVFTVDPVTDYLYVSDPARNRIVVLKNGEVVGRIGGQGREDLNDVREIAIDPDGRILVAVFASNQIASSQNPVFVYAPDGRFAGSFTTNANIFPVQASGYFAVSPSGDVYMSEGNILGIRFFRNKSQTAPERNPDRPPPSTAPARRTGFEAVHPFDDLNGIENPAVVAVLRYLRDPRAENVPVRAAEQEPEGPAVDLVAEAGGSLRENGASLGKMNLLFDMHAEEIIAMEKSGVRPAQITEWLAGLDQANARHYEDQIRSGIVGQGNKSQQRALRELDQNSITAIAQAREAGLLGPEEGEIVHESYIQDDMFVYSVKDPVGMSGWKLVRFYFPLDESDARDSDTGEFGQGAYTQYIGMDEVFVRTAVRDPADPDYGNVHEMRIVMDPARGPVLRSWKVRRPAPEDLKNYFGTETRLMRSLKHVDPQLDHIFLTEALQRFMGLIRSPEMVRTAGEIPGPRDIRMTQNGTSLHEKTVRLSSAPVTVLGKVSGIKLLRSDGPYERSAVDRIAVRIPDRKELGLVHPALWTRLRQYGNLQLLLPHNTPLNIPRDDYADEHLYLEAVQKAVLLAVMRAALKEHYRSGMNLPGYPEGFLSSENVDEDPEAMRIAGLFNEGRLDEIAAADLRPFTESERKLFSLLMYVEFFPATENREDAMTLLAYRESILEKHGVRKSRVDERVLERTRRVIDKTQDEQSAAFQERVKRAEGLAKAIADSQANPVFNEAEFIEQHFKDKKEEYYRGKALFEQMLRGIFDIMLVPKAQVVYYAKKEPAIMKAGGQTLFVNLQAVAPNIIRMGALQGNEQAGFAEWHNVIHKFIETLTHEVNHFSAFEVPGSHSHHGPDVKDFGFWHRQDLTLGRTGTYLRFRRSTDGVLSVEPVRRDDFLASPIAWDRRGAARGAARSEIRGRENYEVRLTPDSERKIWQAGTARGSYSFEAGPLSGEEREAARTAIESILKSVWGSDNGDIVRDRTDTVIRGAAAETTVFLRDKATGRIAALLTYDRSFDYVTEIGVARNYRGTGAADILLEKLKDLLSGTGITKLSATVIREHEERAHDILQGEYQAVLQPGESAETFAARAVEGLKTALGMRSAVSIEALPFHELGKEGDGRSESRRPILEPDLDPGEKRLLEQKIEDLWRKFVLNGYVYHGSDAGQFPGLEDHSLKPGDPFLTVGKRPFDMDDFDVYAEIYGRWTGENGDTEYFLDRNRNAFFVAPDEDAARDYARTGPESLHYFVKNIRILLEAYQLNRIAPGRRQYVDAGKDLPALERLLEKYTRRLEGRRPVVFRIPIQAAAALTPFKEVYTDYQTFRKLALILLNIEIESSGIDPEQWKSVDLEKALAGSIRRDFFDRSIEQDLPWSDNILYEFLPAARSEVRQEPRKPAVAESLDSARSEVRPSANAKGQEIIPKPDALESRQEPRKPAVAESPDSGRAGPGNPEVTGIPESLKLRLQQIVGALREMQQKAGSLFGEEAASKVSESIEAAASGVESFLHGETAISLEEAGRRLEAAPSALPDSGRRSTLSDPVKKEVRAFRTALYEAADAVRVYLANVRTASGEMEKLKEKFEKEGPAGLLENRPAAGDLEAAFRKAEGGKPLEFGDVQAILREAVYETRTTLIRYLRENKMRRYEPLKEAAARIIPEDERFLAGEACAGACDMSQRDAGDRIVSLAGAGLQVFSHHAEWLFGGETQHAFLVTSNGYLVDPTLRQFFIRDARGELSEPVGRRMREAEAERGVNVIDRLLKDGYVELNEDVVFVLHHGFSTNTAGPEELARLKQRMQSESTSQGIYGAYGNLGPITVEQFREFTPRFAAERFTRMEQHRSETRREDYEVKLVPDAARRLWTAETARGTFVFEAGSPPLAQTASDLAAIDAILESVWGPDNKDIAKARTRELMDGISSENVVLLRDNGTGSIAGLLTYDPAMNHLNEIGVAADYRGSGAADILLEKLNDILAAGRVSRLTATIVRTHEGRAADIRAGDFRIDAGPDETPAGFAARSVHDLKAALGIRSVIVTAARSERRFVDWKEAERMLKEGGAGEKDLLTRLLAGAGSFWYAEGNFRSGELQDKFQNAALALINGNPQPAGKLSLDPAAVLGNILNREQGYAGFFDTADRAYLTGILDLAFPPGQSPAAARADYERLVDRIAPAPVSSVPEAGKGMKAAPAAAPLTIEALIAAKKEEAARISGSRVYRRPSLTAFIDYADRAKVLDGIGTTVTVPDGRNYFLEIDKSLELLGWYRGQPGTSIPVYRDAAAKKTNEALRFLDAEEAHRRILQGRIYSEDGIAFFENPAPRSETRGFSLPPEALRMSRRTFNFLAAAGIMAAAVPAASQFRMPPDKVRSLDAYLDRVLRKKALTTPMYRQLVTDLGVTTPEREFREQKFPDSLRQSLKNAFMMIYDVSPEIFNQLVGAIHHIVLLDAPFPAMAHKRTGTILFTPEYVAERKRESDYVAFLAHEGFHLRAGSLPRAVADRLVKIDPRFELFRQARGVLRDPLIEELATRMATEPLFDKVFGPEDSGNLFMKFEIEQVSSALKAARETGRPELVRESFLALFIKGEVEPTLPEGMDLPMALGLTRAAVERLRETGVETPIVKYLFHDGKGNLTVRYMTPAGPEGEVTVDPSFLRTKRFLNDYREAPRSETRDAAGEPGAGRTVSQRKNALLAMFQDGIRALPGLRLDGVPENTFSVFSGVEFNRMSWDVHLLYAIFRNDSEILADDLFNTEVEFEFPGDKRVVIMNGSFAAADAGQLLAEGRIQYNDLSDRIPLKDLVLQYRDQGKVVEKRLFDFIREAGFLDADAAPDVLEKQNLSMEYGYSMRVDADRVLTMHSQKLTDNPRITFYFEGDGTLEVKTNWLSALEPPRAQPQDNRLYIIGGHTHGIVRLVQKQDGRMDYDYYENFTDADRQVARVNLREAVTAAGAARPVVRMEFLATEVEGGPFQLRLMLTEADPAAALVRSYELLFGEKDGRPQWTFESPARVEDLAGFMAETAEEASAGEDLAKPAEGDRSELRLRNAAAESAAGPSATAARSEIHADASDLGQGRFVAAVLYADMQGIDVPLELLRETARDAANMELEEVEAHLRHFAGNPRFSGIFEDMKQKALEGWRGAFLAEIGKILAGYRQQFPETYGGEISLGVILPDGHGAVLNRNIASNLKADPFRLRKFIISGKNTDLSAFREKADVLPVNDRWFSKKPAELRPTAVANLKSAREVKRADSLFKMVAAEGLADIEDTQVRDLIETTVIPALAAMLGKILGAKSDAERTELEGALIRALGDIKKEKVVAGSGNLFNIVASALNLDLQRRILQAVAAAA